MSEPAATDALLDATIASLSDSQLAERTSGDGNCLPVSRVRALRDALASAGYDGSADASDIPESVWMNALDEASEHLARAMGDLPRAERVGQSVVYWEQGTQAWWLVTRSDAMRYGADYADREDGYSLWCAATAALELARDGSTPIDDLVLFGSPGILTNDAADFGLDGGGTYVMEADRDPVADANAFGGDPQDADGVTNLAAWDSRGHSQYLSANGQNKYGDLMSRGNIAAVATGHPENAIEQPGGNHGSGDAARKAAPGLLGLAGPAGAVTGAAVGLNDFIRGRH